MKRAKGNPGRRKIHEPDDGQSSGAAATSVKPPIWLDTSSVKTAQARRISKMALEVWNRSYPLAEQLRLIKATDIEPFARWCRYLAEWVEYTRDIDKRGSTYETKSPHVELMIRANPSTHLRRQVESSLKDLEDRLGFTPAARMRLFQQLAAQQSSLPLDQPRATNPATPSDGGQTPADQPAAEDAWRSPLGLLTAGQRPN